MVYDFLDPRFDRTPTVAHQEGSQWKTGSSSLLNSHRCPAFTFFILRPLPPRPGKPEPIYQEIPANGLKAPLAKEEEEEYDEAKYEDGEEKGFLQPRVPTPSSVTEEDEDGYLKPNFHR